MAAATPSTKPKRPGADERRAQKREQLWPNSGALIFDLSKAETAGYVRMPRIVPMMTALLNNLSGKLNAGPLYAALWVNDYGQGLVEVKDYRYLLHEAGYDTKAKGRARRTWNERIKIMKDLNFIATASNGIEDDAFILLYNPFHVAAWLYERKVNGDKHVSEHLEKDWWSLFCDRCKAVGFNMDEYLAALAQIRAQQAAQAAAAAAASTEKKEGA